MPNWDKRQVAPGVKLPWGPLSSPYLYDLLRTQSASSGGFKYVSSGWLKRQQDFAELALNIGVELSTANMRDPSRTLELLTDFQKASVQYVAEEMREYIEMMTHGMTPRTGLSHDSQIPEAA